jgi:hypothetical protein
MTRRIFGVLLAVLMLTTAACGGDSGNSPSDIIAGTWNGTITSNISSPGHVTTTLTRSGSRIGGTWSMSDGDGNSNSGSVDGTLSGSSLTLTLNPSDPTTCPFNVTATINGSSMSGTYAAFQCTVSLGGSLTLTKQ